MNDFTKIVLGDFIETLTDYHANGSYKILKENVDLKETPDYAIMIRTLNFERPDFKNDLIYLNEQEYNYLKKTKVYPNDILMNKIANPGTVYLMPDLDKPVSLAMNLFLIRFNENVNQQFMYYLMKSNEKYIKRFANGTTTLTITKDSVRGLEFKVPQKNTQNKIAEVLSNIESKIELNNKINTELEAMSKLIYNYWFVQFDFPDSSGNPYKSSGGKMVYNEKLKREIPENWDTNTLADWIKSDKTGDWGRAAKEGNYTLQVDCIRGADINGLNGKGKVKSPNRFLLQKNKHKILLPFDLIIEISGGSPTQSTGRMAFLTQEIFDRFEHPIICSNFCKAISLKNNSYFYNFVYQWNAIYDNGTLFGWEGKTSGIKNLLFDSFINKHNVCVPPEHLVKRFSKIIEPIQQKKQKSLKENSELEKLRDWLLPMLMNGQVTFK